MDPWQVSCLTRRCREVRFNCSLSQSCIGNEVSSVNHTFIISMPCRALCMHRRGPGYSLPARNVQVRPKISNYITSNALLPQLSAAIVAEKVWDIERLHLQQMIHDCSDELPRPGIASQYSTHLYLCRLFRIDHWDLWLPIKSHTRCNYFDCHNVFIARDVRDSDWVGEARTDGSVGQLAALSVSPVRLEYLQIRFPILCSSHIDWDDVRCDEAFSFSHDPPINGLNLFSVHLR